MDDMSPIKRANDVDPDSSFIVFDIRGQQSLFIAELININKHFLTVLNPAAFVYNDSSEEFEVEEIRETKIISKTHKISFSWRSISSVIDHPSDDLVDIYRKTVNTDA